MRCASQFCLASQAVRNAIHGRTNASCFPFPGSVHRDSPIEAGYCSNATPRISHEHEFLRSVMSARYRFGGGPARPAAIRISPCIGSKPRHHALWIRPTHCAHSRDAAARGHVVSSRVPTCPCPVSGLPCDMLGVARSSGLLQLLPPRLFAVVGDQINADYLSKSLGSDCIDINAFSISSNLVVVDSGEFHAALSKTGA